jgi:hypothetical protein
LSKWFKTSSFDPGERLQAPGSLWYSHENAIFKFQMAKINGSDDQHILANNIPFENSKSAGILTFLNYNPDGIFM